MLGLGLVLAMLGIGIGAIHWAKTLMRDHEMIEERHLLRSSDESREAAIQSSRTAPRTRPSAGADVLKGSLITAVALFPLAILVPFVGNMGGDWNVSQVPAHDVEEGHPPRPDPSGTPIKAADVTIGSVFHVIPEGLDEAEHPLDEKAKAVVLLIRLDPADLNRGQDRKGWSFDGIIAYSKICTHVGCPVALYEQQTHHLLCPCHQSTFDVANGAKVIFGPAKRPLPQLPIAVDDEGYIIAQSDFTRARRPVLLGASGAMTTTATPTPVEKVAAGTADYLDERTGIGRSSSSFARKLFPDHWSFMLGEIALFSFITILISGVFLTIFFVPTMTEVALRGPLRRDARRRDVRGVRVDAAAVVRGAAAACSCGRSTTGRR